MPWVLGTALSLRLKSCQHPPEPRVHMCKAQRSYLAGKNLSKLVTLLPPPSFKVLPSP